MKGNTVMLRKTLFDILVQLSGAGALGIKCPLLCKQDNEILHLATEQHVLPLLACAALRSPGQLFHDDVENYLLELMRTQAAKNLLRNQRVLHLIKEMENAGFSIIVLKGCSVSYLYAYPESRDSVDVDLLIKPEQEHEVYRFLRQYGFSISGRTMTANDSVCEHKKYGRIEIHVSLYPEITKTAWKRIDEESFLPRECTVRIDTPNGSFETLGHLYTLRGAAVRDGAAWAKYITEAITLYGDETEVVFQSHNWPHWGNVVAIEYLENSAAVYKFINDQTLTYLNQGYTSDEISNMIELPEALEKNWYTRQYYGTVAHNSKAVYQKYMGWYDANPVNLNPLTPTESAKKWVEYLGDVEVVLRMAKADFDKGEYQWVAEITNVIVFADPANEAARLLCADALEQLGYQAESGPWRNAYLTAALELRYGNQGTNVGLQKGGGIVMQMTPAMIFDYMGILMDKEAIDRGTLAAMMTATTWMDAGAALTQGFIDGVADPQTCPMDSAAMRTVNRKDAEAKVRLWLERCHSRKQENAAAPPATAQCECSGIPADQLRRRLDLIKPNDR